MRHALHTRRPVHDHKRLFNRLIGNVETRHLHRFDCRGGVGYLVTSRQARQGQVDQPVFVLEHHAAMFLEGKEILTIDRNRAVETIGSRDEHFARRIERLETDDHRAVLLDDARLFGCDQFCRIAEIGLMIDRNRHDERDRRLGNDIGGVETPAKADFHDDRIGGMF
ncbi:Uncharacterised protein [Brucella neotomae]|nr:Uncharacterised protein [Brucella neotomae]